MIDYNELDDTQLSLEVLKRLKPEVFEKEVDIITGSAFGISVWYKDTRGVNGFICSFNINIWNDIMPVALSNNMSMMDSWNEEGVWGVSSSPINSYEDESLQRAIAICFLQMKDAE